MKRTIHFLTPGNKTEEATKVKKEIVKIAEAEGKRRDAVTLEILLLGIKAKKEKGGD